MTISHREKLMMQHRRITVSRSRMRPEKAKRPARSRPFLPPIVRQYIRGRAVNSWQ